MRWLHRFFGREKKSKKGEKEGSLASILKKLGFQIPTLEISPEREEGIMHNLAEKIRNYGLETPALLFLIPFKPISPVASQLTILPLAPFMEVFGLSGFDYVAFFNKRENVDRLINKITEGRDRK